MPKKKMKISICIPVYNEAENVKIIVSKVDNELTPIRDEFDLEYIFTDNHSNDDTFEILNGIAARDQRVKVIRFSRNFGYQKSILHGYLTASGDCAVQLDADLQDPPKAIMEFVNEWKAGAKVVYGIRIARQEAPHLSLLRRLFYRVLNWLSDYPTPLDAGDFRLIDRKVIEALRNDPSEGAYLRGQIARIGFKQVGIPYKRDKRKFGESKFPLPKMISLGIDGIISQSVRPLRFATYLGVLFGILALAGTATYLVARIFLDIYWPPGFATTTILLLMSISLNALMLGIIGEYLARTYHAVARHGQIIEEARINIDPPPP